MNFNQQLIDCDVSTVINMFCMFFVTSNFNQPLNDWDVSKVTDMGYMFYDCTNFNQFINDCIYTVECSTDIYEFGRSLNDSFSYQD